MRKLWSGNCSFRWYAAPIPEIPAPTTSTSTCWVFSVVPGAASAVKVILAAHLPGDIGHLGS